MNESSFGGGWVSVIIIILIVLIGFGNGGLFGGNANTAAYATMADVNAAINNQSLMQGVNAVQLSSQNNNYETARLISDQNMSMMQQNNTNLLAAINGFNAVNLNIANNFSTVNQNMANGFNSVNQNIAELGYRMDKCCCDIKTLLLENRLQDAQTALNQQFTAISNAEQSQYILSQLGSFQPKAAVL